MVMELSEYTLETLRTDGDFILFRGRHRNHNGTDAPLILAVTPVIDLPTLVCLRACPRLLNRHEDRTFLILNDSGGKPLDLVLQRHLERPLDWNRYRIPDEE